MVYASSFWICPSARGLQSIRRLAKELSLVASVLALGTGHARAQCVRCTVLGQDAGFGLDVLHDNITAFGYRAGYANYGSFGTAFGSGAGSTVTGSGNTAVGGEAGQNVTGAFNTATGRSTGQNVVGDNNVAIGANAGSNIGALGAPVSNTVAIGNTATASANDAIAVGRFATAALANSAAFGQGANTTRVGQMVFGTVASTTTVDSTYTMPGITTTASTAAETGPKQLVTTDANGNLASDGGATAAALPPHRPRRPELRRRPTRHSRTPTPP